MKKKQNYWNYETCKKVSLKYATRNHFALGSPSAYNASWRNKWLDDFFPNTRITKPKNYWNYETCKEESLKYKNRSEFLIKNVGASTVSRKNNWLTIFYPNDKPITIKKPKNYWNYETCKEESLKYKNKVDFKNSSIGAYNTSWKNKWLIEFYPNDKILHRRYPRNYWNYKTCKEESLKVKTRSEFQKISSTGYLIASKNKWLDEFFPLKKIRKPKNYWNYETCKEESLKFKTRNEFQKNSSRAYNTSWRNKWVDEFFPKK